jgi:mitochondrial fission process protein 1
VKLQHTLRVLTCFRTGDSTDSNYRYAAYAARARTILMSAHRYVAYTSDIGESFRPIAHPWLVRSAYGISWAYLIGDVSHEGYKAYCRNQRLLHPSPEAVKKASGTNANVTPETVSAMTKNKHIPAIEDWRAVMVQRAVFQSIASMGLPAFTIHSIVRYSGRAMKNVKNPTLRSWGPIGVSLPPRGILFSLLTSYPAWPCSRSSPTLHVR